MDNKIIQAGDTLGAAVKIGAALGVVYVGYKIYRSTQQAAARAEEFKQDVSQVTGSVTTFFSETINPASRENFIFKASEQVGRKVGSGIFDLLN